MIHNLLQALPYIFASIAETLAANADADANAVHLILYPIIWLCPCMLCTKILIRHKIYSNSKIRAGQGGTIISYLNLEVD